VERRVWQQSVLLAAALFVFGLAIFRAGTQAITVDEATSYFWWASGSTYSPWFPSANNHILNSLLMRLSTHAFGVSSLTVRMPALLGAALYISICYFLCRSLTARFSLQLPVFLCLIYNPFILDFMIAARGYGLANAFLLAAIAIPLWHGQTPGASLSKSCAWASLALGLSFTANFSFAFVDVAMFLAIVIWALKSREIDSSLRILGFCVLPGLSVALLLCGYPLTHWPSGELWIGAHSLQEMERSLIEASLHQLDPRFHDAGWYRIVHSLRAHLLPYAGILCIAQLVVAALDGSFRKQPRLRRLPMFAGALAAVVILTILVHWLAFRFDNLPLPEARTGIFLLPIFTLIAAAIAASPARSLISQGLRIATTVALFCVAAYFLLCLRVSYFEEYQWDQDVKDVYGVLAGLNHASGVTDIAVSDLYHAPLNFYRVVSGRETFPEFTGISDELHPSPGKALYVMGVTFHQSFIDAEKLKVIYHGKSTDVVVAIRPVAP
jgi:hypothetical protein